MSGQGREHRSEAAADREGASQRGASEARTDRGGGLDRGARSGAPRGSERRHSTDTAVEAGPAGEPLDALIAGLAVDVPDWPLPGVVFRDLTPVFADGDAFRRMVEGLASPSRVDPRAAAVSGADGHPGRSGFDIVVGVEARGFLLAAAVALDAGVGVVPVRKAGKLPRERIAAEYALEYGTATLELHTDAIRPGQRVLLVDDVLATGGTLGAAIALVEQLGGVVTAVSVVIELTALGGRQRIAPHTVHALWQA